MCRASPVPKAFGIVGDESARNEILILIAGMPRAVEGSITLICNKSCGQGNEKQ